MRAKREWRWLQEACGKKAVQGPHSGGLGYGWVRVVVCLPPPQAAAVVDCQAAPLAPHTLKDKPSHDAMTPIALLPGRRKLTPQETAQMILIAAEPPVTRMAKILDAMIRAKLDTDPFVAGLKLRLKAPKLDTIRSPADLLLRVRAMRGAALGVNGCAVLGAAAEPRAVLERPTCGHAITACC